MYHVLRIFRHPHFRLPGNLCQETPHDIARRKRGDENQSRLATRKQFFQFLAALAINRPGAGHRFDEQQPISFCVMNNNIRHFGRCGNHDTKSLQVIRIEVKELIFRIADVNDRATGHEARAEFLNHGFDKRIMSARRNGHGFT